jgi:DDE superfamily endonuclease
MPDIPMAIMTVLGAFASLFSRRVFAQAKLLLVGAILAPGHRTVTAGLRGLGRSAEAHFQHDHRVLNRAQGSPLDASRRLLGWLLDALVPDGPVVMGIEETRARRRGARPQGSTAIPCARHMLTWSTPAGGAGSA